MSAVIERVSTRDEARETWAATLVVIVGCAVLVARPFAEAAAGTRTALFAASYLTIGLASIAVPLPWSAAALPLSLLAAVAEEALFRRLAYARLERFGAAVAVLSSALLFGLVHVPAYGLAALPVDVGAGLLFGWQRWASGTWTVPAATHAFANAMVVLR